MSPNSNLPSNHPARVQVWDCIDRFINELVAFTKPYDDFLGLCIYIFHQRNLLALFAIAVLIDTNATNPEIVGFNMPSRKWKSFLDALSDLLLKFITYFRHTLRHPG